jgi:glycine cleavage system H protein
MFYIGDSPLLINEGVIIMSVPTELKYEKEQHIWVAVDGNIATIGITDFAQEQLGGLLFIELPEVDDELAKGDELFVVESSKKSTSLEAPFAFKVVEVNEEVDEEPEVLNGDPYGKWIVKVEITDELGMEDLVAATDYQAAIA